MASIERGLEVRPDVVVTEVEPAQRAIAQVRDQLIARQRQEGDAPNTPRLRSALDQINVALSLVIGVEYPAVGVRRASLEQARRILAELIAGEVT
ncbi:MAG: hypothetical protein AB7R89_16780 [Dehalococcoidia bacterium]